MFHGKISSVVDYLCHNVNANHNVHKSRKDRGVAKKRYSATSHSILGLWLALKVKYSCFSFVLLKYQIDRIKWIHFKNQIKVL